MYKRARGKKPYSSPKLAQISEPHSEPKETRGSGTAKQWKKKVEFERQRIREKLEARRREGFTPKATKPDSLTPTAEIPSSGPKTPAGKPGRGLTIEQAKEGLAKTFGVSPEAVEITIRG